MDALPGVEKSNLIRRNGRLDLEPRGQLVPLDQPKRGAQILSPHFQLDADVGTLDLQLHNACHGSGREVHKEGAHAYNGEACALGHMEVGKVRPHCSKISKLVKLVIPTKANRRATGDALASFCACEWNGYGAAVQSAPSVDEPPAAAEPLAPARSEGASDECSWPTTLGLKQSGAIRLGAARRTDCRFLGGKRSATGERGVTDKSTPEDAGKGEAGAATFRRRCSAARFCALRCCDSSAACERSARSFESHSRSTRRRSSARRAARTCGGRGRWRGRE